MKVCVVGSGGREHALAHVLARTASSVVVSPGNPGIPGSVPTPPEEIDADLFVEWRRDGSSVGVVLAGLALAVWGAWPRRRLRVAP